MAVFTETRKPYEFLVRWNAEGLINGAHVGFITRTFKDGVEIAAQPENVMPVAVGTAQGYPLQDILGQIQIDAIAAMDAAIAAKDSAVAESSQLTADKAAMQDEINRLTSLLAASMPV